MTTEKLHFRVPSEKGHAHFLDSIESFPGLETGPSYQDRQKYYRDMIRYQLLTTTPEQARRHVTLKQCFKLQERRYVQFCLQKKLPGTTIRQAAEELGLRK